MRSLPMAFGKAVRRLRSERGFSQEKFAARAHISRTYMSEIERGVTGVSLESVARIAKALDVTMSALLRQVEDAR
jgi:transcriptional regulator with XRE-family HTH domain